MATPTNTTSSPSIATVLCAQANAVAHIKMKSVQNVADVVARMMEDIHGGEFRVHCDHQRGVILICAVDQGPVNKPRDGALV